VTIITADVYSGYFAGASKQYGIFVRGYDAPVRSLGEAGCGVLFVSEKMDIEGTFAVLLVQGSYEPDESIVHLNVVLWVCHACGTTALGVRLMSCGIVGDVLARFSEGHGTAAAGAEYEDVHSSSLACNELLSL